MKRLLKTAVLPIFFLIACNVDKTLEIDEIHTIKLVFDDSKVAKLSDFVESNSVILLDDSDETYIGSITQIDIVDTIIVITDINTKSVLLYDFTGNLINKIKSEGRGPGEYTSIQQTSINHKTREIVIYDRKQAKMLYFSMNGEFLREMRAPFFLCGFAFSGDYSYYYRSRDGYPDDEMKPSNYHLLLTSKDSIRIDMKRDFFLENSMYLPYEDFVRSNNNVLFLTPQEQNIYEISGMDISLKYHVQLGPNPRWVNKNYMSIKSMDDLKKSKETSIGSVEGLRFMGSDRYLLFRIAKRIDRTRSTNVITIYDMKEDREKISYHYLTNDIDGFLISDPYFFNDSLFISSFHQYQFDEGSLDAIAHIYNIDFSRSINPILVISKLKFDE